MLDMILPFAYLPSFRDGQIDVRNIFERVMYFIPCHDPYLFAMGVLNCSRRAMITR